MLASIFFASEMPTCRDSDDMCNFGSLQHSTIHPNKLLGSTQMWGRTSSYDDMCQIDDKDNTILGEVKLSPLTPDNFKVTEFVPSLYG